MTTIRIYSYSCFEEPNIVLEHSGSLENLVAIFYTKEGVYEEAVEMYGNNILDWRDHWDHILAPHGTAVHIHECGSFEEATDGVLIFRQ